MQTIKELRKKYGRTQQDVANHLNCSYQAVAGYEKGRSEPDYATLIKIADFFNVTTDYLLGRESVKPQMPKVSFTFENGLVEEIELTDEEIIKLKKIIETLEIGKKKN